MERVVIGTPQRGHEGVEPAANASRMARCSSGSYWADSDMLSADGGRGTQAQG